MRTFRGRRGAPAPDEQSGPWWYYPDYSQTPADYARFRAVLFLVVGATCAIAAFVAEPALLFMTAFCLWAAMVWWWRWRRFLDDVIQAAGEEYEGPPTDQAG